MSLTNVDQIGISSSGSEPGCPGVAISNQVVFFTFVNKICKSRDLLDSDSPDDIVMSEFNGSDLFSRLRWPGVEDVAVVDVAERTFSH